MIKILVCNPAFYDVTYSINPWMAPEHGIDSKLAADQWKNLVVLLEHVGANVIHMSGRPNLPDIVFTANAGFCDKNFVILANFKHPERQPERQIYKEWFESKGYQCSQILDDIPWEGAGDVLRRCSDVKELYFGHGFRSSENASNDGIWPLVFPGYSLTKLKLVDPYFYHLDTCFCPLPGDFALVYPEAFDKSSWNELKSHGPFLLQVPEDEARRFACNAVSVNNCVIIPAGCPRTKKLLQSAGYEVFDTDMSEYIKAGGACKCLTLKLETMQ